MLIVYMTSLSFFFVLRILFNHAALNHIISHFCHYSLAIYYCAQIICKLDNPCTDNRRYAVIVILVLCMMSAGCVASVWLALFLQGLSYYHISEINNVMCEQVAANVSATTCLVCC